MGLFDASFWAIVPALVTIALAIITKEVILSMSVGIALGCLLMYDLHPLQALAGVVEVLVGTVDDSGAFQAGVITSRENAMILLMLLLEGAMIGLLVRSGGSAAFARALRDRADTERRTLLVTMGVGVLLLFDDYFALLTNTAVTRGLSDRNGVAREKYTYVVDSTTFAACQLSPVSSWVAFICGVVTSGLAAAQVTGVNPYQLFLSTIPTNFYAWTSLIFIFLVICFRIEIGPMKRAACRTRETGRLCDQEFAGEGDDFAAIRTAAHGRICDLVIPVVVLVSCIVCFMLYTGGFFHSFRLMDAVSHMEGIRGMMMGFVTALIFMFIYMRLRRVGTIAELIDVCFIGAKSMAYGAAVLAMGWSIGSIAGKLGATEFVISVFGGNVPAVLVPAVVFLLCAGIAIAMGGDWITYAMMIPIVLPLAAAMDSSLPLCLAAVIGGGALGAGCSPVADTTIVASMGANLSIIDHVRTQAAYAIVCGIIALAAYLAASLSGALAAGYAVMALGLAAAVVVLRKR